MPTSNALLAAELKELGGLGTDELRQRWSKLFGMAASPRISRELLIRAVAYRMQEEAHGGLGKSCQRQLARLAETLGAGGSLEGAQSRSFKPGTKLIREWKGKVHEVVIADDTYIWAGQHYRSLSQIARAITGIDIMLRGRASRGTIQHCVYRLQKLRSWLKALSRIIAKGTNQQIANAWSGSSSSRRQS